MEIAEGKGLVISIDISELQPGDKIGGRTVTVIQRHTRLAIVYVDFADGGKTYYELDTSLLVERDVIRIEKGK